MEGVALLAELVSQPHVQNLDGIAGLHREREREVEKVHNVFFLRIELEDQRDFERHGVLLDGDVESVEGGVVVDALRVRRERNEYFFALGTLDAVTDLAVEHVCEVVAVAGLVVVPPLHRFVVD